jgi:hypothetical protein
MAYVIKIEWLGGIEGAAPSEHEGRYVSKYDPNAHGGQGQVWTCAEPGDALQFPDHASAAEFYRQVSTVRPVRKDGRPNRPLTAFTVTIDVLKVSYAN